MGTPGLRLPIIAIAGLFCAVSSTAFYVPGSFPTEFAVGDELQVHVSTLTSSDTDLPYDYYSVPFCRPEEGVHRIANTANLGTILEGIWIENSPYKFTMKRKQTGMRACHDGSYGPLSAKEADTLRRLIDQHYRVNLILDNMPVATYGLLGQRDEFLRPGFELGYKRDGRYYLNNHLVFNVLVYMTYGEYSSPAQQQFSKSAAAATVHVRRLLHDIVAAAESVTKRGHARQLAGSRFSSDQGDLYEDMLEYDVAASLDPNPPRFMVVGFEVSPCSIARSSSREEDVDIVVCGVEGSDHVKPQEIYEGADIVYTYDVYWQDSKVKWASRWDAYLHMPGGKVHWFSIVNSLLAVLVMAIVVGIILVRTVRSDLAKYQSLMADGEAGGSRAEEAGWKLVAGDVFRAPPNPELLAVQVGTGVQILLASLVTLILAALGFLSPASRGALLTVGLVCFVLLASCAGFAAVYVWGLVQRSFDNWQRIATRVALYYPGLNLVIITVLNLVIHHTGTTGAVPLGMYLTLAIAWLLVATPLAFLGGMTAQHLPLLEWPVKVNQAVRTVPPPPRLANPWLLLAAAGVLPFATMSVELYFAMKSLWFGYLYYLFGFVLLIAALMCIINAEVSVLCTYVQLCAEDHAWWWRSFHRGASVSFYLAIYAVGFLVFSLRSLTGFIPFFIYLSYMTMFVMALYFSMGTLGFGASLWFVRNIFKAVKKD